MAKQSADDFFKSMSGSSSKKTESADSFFERVSKELTGQVEPQSSINQKQVLSDTLESVTKKPQPVVQPKTIDFKAEQAKKKEAAIPAASSIRVTPQETQTLQGKLPAAELLQTNQGIQETLQGKVPAANLVQQTGRGPENASQIPGISQYEITKKEIAEDNAPDAVKAYANIMNYITQGNPIGVAASRAFAGNSGATRRDSTGNAVVDKVTDAVNNLVTPFITPTGAPLTQGIIGSTYGATEKALSGKAGQAILGAAGKVIPGSQNVAKVAATEGIAGGLQGVGFGLQQGQDSGNEIGRNAALGVAAGGVLGGLGAAAGEAFPAILNMFRKSGIADDEIAEIAPELLALPEAQPRTIRKQLAGEIKTSTNTDPVVTPYTFKLDEATPETQAASASRQSSGREAVKVLDPVADTRYQQAVIDEYKRLRSDSAVKTSYKETYEQAVKNVEAQKPANPIVTSKLKDTRINGTSEFTEPSIRNPQTLTREQEIMNKVNAKQPLTQDEIDFAMSDRFDQNKLFPESTPTESTYVKPVKTDTLEIPGMYKTKEKYKDSPDMSAEELKQKLLETKENKPSKIVTEVNGKPDKKTPGERSNYKTIEESGNISAQLKSKVENSPNRNYTIFKDDEANRLANQNVKKLDIAESKFMNNEYTGKESIATGYRVSQELDKLANAETDPDLKKALFGRALAALDKVTADLTRAGQEAQAGSLIKKMSPEGQLQNLIRKAKANDMEVTVADSIEFKEEAAKYIEGDGAGVRENERLDVFDRLEKGDVSREDIAKIEEMMDAARERLGIKNKPKVVKDRLPKELKDTRKRDKVISFLEAQEAAAQERINKRRGRLNSLPVEEWIDYSILIAAKVGKGIIKAETHIEDLVKLFGEDIRPIATQVFEKAQELVGSVTKGSIEGDFIKADKAFKRITGKASLNQQEKIVEKYIATNPEVTPKDIEALRKLSKSLTELQGKDKIKADMAMQKILNNYEKSTPWDKFQAIRYISMLLNDTTQTINALSGPLMASYHATVNVLHTMIDIGMHTTLKTPRNATLYGTNPIRFLAEWFKHAGIGGKAGWNGVNPAGIQNVHEIRGLAFKNMKNPLTVIPSVLERSLGAVAKGADYATYGAVYQAELKKAAFLDAKNSGIKGKKAIENHIRKFINDPTIEAVERADRRGKSTTFQLSDSLGGKTANWLNAAPKPVKPLVTSVVPFVRTPLNMASTAFTASPGGIIKGLIQLSSNSKASQYEAIRSLSMGITGVGMSATGYYLAKIGIITGANDTGNKDVNSINEQAGRAKYRFNTSAAKRYTFSLLRGEGADAAEKAAKYQKGDKQFDYNKLQPLAFPLAMGAGYEEAKGNVLNKGVEAGKQSYNSLFGMTSLKGIQDTFQPQYTGSQGDKTSNVAVRIIESYIKSFSPSALAQEARRQDPVQRKVTYNEGILSDLWTYQKSRTPFGVSNTLPPNKDTLGNTKTYPKGIVGQHLNPYKSEVANYSTAAEFIADLIVRTGDQSIAPAAPFKSVTQDGVTLQITQKRYEKLQEDMGAEITKRIIEIDSGTDQEMIEQIREIYSEVKEEFREEVKDELFN